MNKNIDINSYNGVIFDLDGTLVDSTWVWEQIDIDFLGKRGFDVPDDYSKAIAAMGFEDTARYTIDRFNLNETIEAVTNEWFEMAIDAYTNDVKIKPGALTYLEALKDKGIKMAIATASDLQLVSPVLKSNGISKYFDNITTVREVNRGKGFPDIYNLAANRMNLHNSKCIVFEDIYKAAKGALSGGYRTVGVYDEHSEHDRIPMMDLCDMYIYNFEEMIKEQL